MRVHWIYSSGHRTGRIFGASPVKMGFLGTLPFPPYNKFWGTWIYRSEPLRGPDHGTFHRFSRDWSAACFLSAGGLRTCPLPFCRLCLVWLSHLTFTYCPTTLHCFK
ncbi:uncharacterized protein LOC143222525 [Tachypleus tridentatus]|uniref:uncharacterized protein LOC143222525 n=1 Tax=Tachypleus tridentatus TaxID=6853 RepID=UPI003FD038E5